MWYSLHLPSTADGGWPGSVAESCPTLCSAGNAGHQAPLSSWNLLKFMSTESVMLSNHLILCHPLLLLPSIFPNIRVFSQWVNSLHQYWSWSSNTLVTWCKELTTDGPGHNLCPLSWHRNSSQWPSWREHLFSAGNTRKSMIWKEEITLVI